MSHFPPADYSETEEREMSATHTPGPWMVRPFPGMGIIAIAQSDKIRSFIHVGATDTLTAADYANASLIASAPDLLAALRAMLDVQSRRRHPLGLPDEGIAIDASAAANMARAAIATAEGRAP